MTIDPTKSHRPPAVWVVSFDELSVEACQHLAVFGPPANSAMSPPAITAPATAAGGITDTAHDAEGSVFRLLDCSAAFFEQCYSQHLLERTWSTSLQTASTTFPPAAETSWLDVFGDQAAFLRMRQVLDTENAAATLIHLSHSDPPQAAADYSYAELNAAVDAFHHVRHLNLHELKLTVNAAGCDGTVEHSTDPVNADEQLSDALANAQIVWWRVTGGQPRNNSETLIANHVTPDISDAASAAAGSLPESCDGEHHDLQVARTCDDALKVILRLRDSLQSADEPTYGSTARQIESSGITMIVTAEQGGQRSVLPPFHPRVAESRIRIPLWLLTDKHRLCRIQQLCGTHDVIPTAMALCNLSHTQTSGLAPERPIIPPCVDRPTHDAEAELPDRTRPISLMPFVECPGMAVDRVVRIQGSGWRAVRTKDCLAVRTDLQRPPESCLAPEPVDETGQPVALLESTRQDDTAYEHELAGVRLYIRPEDTWNVNNSAATDERMTTELADYLRD